MNFIEKRFGCILLRFWSTPGTEVFSKKHLTRALFSVTLLSL